MDLLPHGCAFAPTRWTNLYAPVRGFCFGDLVGGPVGPVLGWASMAFRYAGAPTQAMDHALAHGIPERGPSAYQLAGEGTGGRDHRQLPNHGSTGMSTSCRRPSLRSAASSARAHLSRHFGRMPIEGVLLVIAQRVVSLLVLNTEPHRPKGERFSAAPPAGRPSDAWRARAGQIALYWMMRAGSRGSVFRYARGERLSMPIWSGWSAPPVLAQTADMANGRVSIGDR